MSPYPSSRRLLHAHLREGPSSLTRACMKPSCRGPRGTEVPGQPPPPSGSVWMTGWMCHCDEWPVPCLPIHSFPFPWLGPQDQIDSVPAQPPIPTHEASRRARSADLGKHKTNPVSDLRQNPRLWYLMELTMLAVCRCDVTSVAEDPGRPVFALPCAPAFFFSLSEIADAHWIDGSLRAFWLDHIDCPTLPHHNSSCGPNPCSASLFMPLCDDAPWIASLMSRCGLMILCSCFCFMVAKADQ